MQPCKIKNLNIPDTTASEGFKQEKKPGTDKELKTYRLKDANLQNFQCVAISFRFTHTHPVFKNSSLNTYTHTQHTHTHKPRIKRFKGCSYRNPKQI